MPPHDYDFMICCNGVTFCQQEINQLDPSENSEIEDRDPLFLGLEPVQISIPFDFNAYAASLPIEKRYLIHCFFKGWTPSVAGLLGFIRMLRLGYYKTL